MTKRPHTLDTAEDPVGRGLNLDSLCRPVANVQTTQGTMYLYRLRRSDFEAFEDLIETEPSSRLRAFLPCMASLAQTARWNEERQPLASKYANELTDEDLERIADTYAQIVARGVRPNDHQDKPQRHADERATAFLDRLLKYVVEDAQRAERLSLLQALETSESSIFDKVRNSSSALGSTLGEFNRLSKERTRLEVPGPDTSVADALKEHQARLSRERAEEIDMVRLTSKMTAESAQTLKDLAEAATVLMERLDDRDRKSDESTRTQIKIAVWSVASSAILAFIALIVSVFGVFQDNATNESGEAWQTELLSAIQNGNHQQSAMEQEIERLRAQILTLETKGDQRVKGRSGSRIDGSTSSKAIR